MINSLDVLLKEVDEEFTEFETLPYPIRIIFRAASGFLKGGGIVAGVHIAQQNVDSGIVLCGGMYAIGAMIDEMIARHYEFANHGKVRRTIRNVVRYFDKKIDSIK
jgi:hypothetical protein